MRLHWDLIRLILLREEAKGEDEGEASRLEEEIKNGWAGPQIAYNAAAIIDGGFAKGAVLRGPMGEVNRAHIIHLHLSGHELARSLQSRPLWEKIKEEATNRGIGLTFDVVVMLARVAYRRVLGDEGTD